MNTQISLSSLGIISLACTCSLIGGCAGHPKIPKVISPERVQYTVNDLELHRGKYTGAVIGKDLPMAKFWRDTMIGYVRRDITSYYDQFEGQLANSRKTFTSVADVASVAGVAAATIDNGARSKTVISALVAFVQGAQGKIDKNTFKEQTTELLIQKMRATRLRIDTSILDKMVHEDAIQYTFGEAEDDLRDLFWAGTLESALVELAADTGHDTKTAQAAKIDFTNKRLGHVDQKTLDLSTRVTERRAELENKWSNNKNTDKGKAVIEEIKKILTDCCQVSSTNLENASGDEIIQLLRDKIAEATTDPKKLEPIARAMGLKTTE